MFGMRVNDENSQVGIHVNKPDSGQKWLYFSCFLLEIASASIEVNGENSLPRFFQNLNYDLIHYQSFWVPE